MRMYMCFMKSWQFKKVALVDVKCHNVILVTVIDVDQKFGGVSTLIRMYNAKLLQLRVCADLK